MLSGIKKFIKRFGTDLAGYLCLLLVIPVGSLPGPGGIPLLIVGLGLLAVHNEWAKRLLAYAEEQTDSLRSIFFPKNRAIERLWDAFAVSLFAFSMWYGITYDHRPHSLIATVLGAGASTLFMTNRDRLGFVRTKLTRKKRL